MTPRETPADPAKILSVSRDLFEQVGRGDAAAWVNMTREERTRWAAGASAVLEAVIVLLEQP